MLEVLTDRGRKKRVERLLVANCHICGAQLRCPDGADPWAWIKSGDVEDFLSSHRSYHGFPKAAGVEIRYVEKD